MEFPVTHDFLADKGFTEPGVGEELCHPPISALKLAIFYATGATANPLQVKADIHALMQHANDNKFPLGETIKHKMGPDSIFEVAVTNIDNPSGFSAGRQTIESIDNLPGMLAAHALEERAIVKLCRLAGFLTDNELFL